MFNLGSSRIILASKSPRRQELLKGLCVDFDIKTKEIDESYPANLKEAEVPTFIALKKADAFKEELAPNDILITSDTVVCLDGEILEKPVDPNDAKRMLTALSGKQHTVYSAVCLTSKNKQISFCDSTLVKFKVIGQEEIEFYIEKFKPFDKAGAYGVQEWIGYIGIEQMIGSYYTVMGMPMHLLYDELKKF